MEYAELRYEPTRRTWALRVNGDSTNQLSGGFSGVGLSPAESRTQAEILLSRWGYALGAAVWVQVDSVWLIPVLRGIIDRYPDPHGSGLSISDQQNTEGWSATSSPPQIR